MMNYDVFRSDGGKAIPAVVFYSLGKPGVERREQQVGSVLGDQMANIRKSHDAVEPDDIPRRGAGSPTTKSRRRSGVSAEKDNRMISPRRRRLSADSKHCHQVLRLFFNFDVAVL